MSTYILLIAVPDGPFLFNEAYSEKTAAKCAWPLSTQ